MTASNDAANCPARSRPRNRNRGGVPLIDDQEAVEELTTQAADEACGDGLGPRRAHRRLDDPHVGCGEHGVEGRGELGVTVVDEELQTEVVHKVSGSQPDPTPPNRARQPTH